MTDRQAGNGTRDPLSWRDLAPGVHVANVEAAINEHLGGDGTVRDIVRLMLLMGWAPPKTAYRITIGTNGFLERA